MNSPSIDEDFDWIIYGGRVIDPANRVDGIRDIAIRDGKICAVAKRIYPGASHHVYDATDKIVTPGLIDLHVHGYDLVTPLGIPVDHYCLRRGVTTAVDAGSAGCSTFAGLRGYVVERSITRVLAFLNISCAGLAFGGLGGDENTPGELDLLKLVSVQACVDCIQAHRDTIVGVKLRLSDSCAGEGANEDEAYSRAIEAATAVQLPLMVHHSFSTIPLEDCPGKMRQGDIYTHTYHGFPSTIIDSVTKEVHPAVISSRANGVLFDLGHGQGAFSWTVAEICAQSQFWPDTISSDLHSGTCEGPAYDLPTVMSRILHVGLPLYQVIERVTIAPARAIGWDDRIGTLGIGREADVTVMSVESVNLELEDCQSQLRQVSRRLVPQQVWRAGVAYQTTKPRLLPNPETITAQRRWWDRLEVRDLTH